MSIYLSGEQFWLMPKIARQVSHEEKTGCCSSRPHSICKAHQSLYSSPLSSLQLHASAACTLRISGGQRPVTATWSREQLELQRWRCVKHEGCTGDLMVAFDENYDRALTIVWSFACRDGGFATQGLSRLQADRTGGLVPILSLLAFLSRPLRDNEVRVYKPLLTQHGWSCRRTPYVTSWNSV